MATKKAAARKRSDDVGKARTQILAFFDRISDPSRQTESFGGIGIPALDRAQFRELLGTTIADLRIREEAAQQEDDETA